MGLVVVPVRLLVRIKLETHIYMYSNCAIQMGLASVSYCPPLCEDQIGCTYLPWRSKEFGHPTYN